MALELTEMQEQMKDDFLYEKDPFKKKYYMDSGGVRVIDHATMRNDEVYLTVRVVDDNPFGDKVEYEIQIDQFFAYVERCETLYGIIRGATD